MRSELQAWAFTQIDPWRTRSVTSSAAAVAEQSKSVFRFTFHRDGRVVRHSKELTSPAYDWRAWAYNHLFLEIAPRLSIRANFDLALDVCDGCGDWRDYPVFTFQRPKGFLTPLLPDIDFLATEFYTDEAWCLPDPIPIALKRPGALFAGATTGGGVISPAILAANAVPRVRAARFFKALDDPRVRFTLPALAQCDAEAEVALRAEGFGGVRVPLVEQLGHRAVIAIDGNGAPCSRMVTGLSCNSALLKYKSDYDLFYFEGLRAGEHFISIDRDSDVITAIDNDKVDRDRFDKVGAAGRDFAAFYLTREAICEYTITILRSYISIFSNAKS